MRISLNKNAVSRRRPLFVVLHTLRSRSLRLSTKQVLFYWDKKFINCEL